MAKTLARQLRMMRNRRVRGRELDDSNGFAAEERIQARWEARSAWDPAVPADAFFVETLLYSRRISRVYLASKRNTRASYNGSIEASQASDVGSIPIARSNKTNHLTSASCCYGCSIWLQLKVFCNLFNWNLARVERSHIGSSVAHLLTNHCG